MELTYYLSILRRRLWLILLASLLAAGLAYYLVLLKPPVYKSEAIVSTGVIDYTGINSGRDNPYLQQLHIDMQFNNLLECVISRRCLTLLSFHLLNHDLEPDSFGEGPFRSDVDLSEYEWEDLQALNSLLETKLAELRPEFVRPEDELFFNKVAKTFGYDYETLKEKNVRIERVRETDYVKFSFESESPDMSAFAASQYSNSFINYFETLRNSENEASVEYLDGKVREKRRTLKNKEGQLERYKSQRSLVDLETQREATVNQIKELEQQRNDAVKEINANKKTIINLERLMENTGSAVVASNLDDDGLESLEVQQLNRKIVNLEQQVREIQNDIIDRKGNKRKNESRLRSVKRQLDVEMKKLSQLQRQTEILRDDPEDKTIANELYGKHLDAQIALTAAEEQLEIIDEKLAELKVRSRSYVSSEAYVNNLEREIEIAKDDYEMVVKKLEEDRLENNRDESPLTIIEHAHVPEEPESDQKMLITAFSGVVGGSLATFFIFFLAFLDNTLHSAKQFQTFTGLPLVGRIPKINTKKLDLQALFAEATAHPKLERFKELVRNLRFNVEKVEEGNIFLVTSPREEEGKTFLMVTLAHALRLKNKRGLLIDTNFKHNTLSTWAQAPLPESTALHNLLVDAKLSEHFAVSSVQSPYNNLPIESISNSGRSQSPLEGIDETAFSRFLHQLSERYDYVFLEGAALNEYADTKELIEFSDRVIGVFSADSTLQPADRVSIAFLKEMRHKFIGAVLNQIHPKNLA